MKQHSLRLYLASLSAVAVLGSTAQAAESEPTTTPSAEVQQAATSATQAVELTAPGAELQKVATGFKFTEGPMWDAKNQALYFTDLPRANGTIFRWTQQDGAKLWREQVRAIGLAFDSTDTLYGASGKGRAILKFDDQGTSSTVVTEFEGKKLNSPNDLWIDSKDGIYFSDPRYGDTAGVEQDGFYVFYLSPDRQQLSKVADDLVRPNGLAGTADGSKLYVADEGGKKIYGYDIQPDGTLANKKLFVEKGADGMAVDEKNNVYLVTKDTKAVEIYSPEGQLLQTIEVPEPPTNLAFGGADGKTLFITAATSVYSIAMTVTGN